MADYYLLENGTDRFLLEDGSGLLLLEQQASGDVFIDGLHRIETGIVVQTAAGLNGVLYE